MIDIKLIRENPDLVRENIRKKFQDSKLPLVDQVLELDVENRKIKTQVQELLAKRNAAGKQIGGLMKQGKKEEAEALKAEMAAAGADIEKLSEAEKNVEEALNKIMMIIPNIIDDSVPIGKSDEEKMENLRYFPLSFPVVDTVSIWTAHAVLQGMVFITSWAVSLSSIPLSSHTLATS